MKKKIITTHIDTGGHGYLSVSKADFLLAGGDPTKVSKCSGHSLTRIYLEEDCDQSYFWDVATANGFEIIRKSGYNLHFKITHNYKPELFDFIPEAGDNIMIGESSYQVIHGHGEEGLNGIGILSKENGRRYKIAINNPFSYITAGKKLKTILSERKA